MNCFIEDYNLVLIESEDYINDVILLDEKLTFYKKEKNKQYFKSANRIPLHIADKVIVDGKEHDLKIGLVTLKEDFEKHYRYDGWLGNKYTKTNTEFRVFTPVAKNVYVVINDEKHPMTYEEPIWKLTLKGDYENTNYHYLVDLNGKLESVSDPYALAGNIDDSYIFDFSKTYKMKHGFDKTSLEDMVIYEGHIRDMSYNLDVPNSKNYLGITEDSKELNGSVLDYIKDINITHLQVLPVQDFIGVDPFNKDKMYNWGYNPQSYFTLSSWYSSNPSNPVTAINEFKMLVDKVHEKGLAINVDVVYNHVYERGMFPYDKLVPGYFYRHDENFKGTNSTMVGNDVETTNYMVRKLVVDSMVYLTKEFKIDGYRFDLMGLMDLQTMLDLEVELKKVNPNIKLYGEGWNIPNTLEPKDRSNMANNKAFPYYGHFNDFFRDTLKGDQFELGKGYLAGKNDDIFKVLIALKGSSNIFGEPLQSVNYIDCHDNLTYPDYLTLAKTNEDEMKYYLDLGNHLVAIAKGVPFYHAGQELYRSKKLHENTYNQDDTYNAINWDIPESIENFKRILEIRKEFGLPEGTYSTKIEGNLIRLKIINKDKGTLYIYIKNDFISNHLLEKRELIFNSQEVTVNKNQYVIDYPGVYIFKAK